MRKPVLMVVFMLVYSTVIVGKSQAIYDRDDRRFVVEACDDAIYTRQDYLQLARSICLIVPKECVLERWETGGEPVDYPVGGVDLSFYGKLEDFIFNELHPTDNGEPVSDELNFHGKSVADLGVSSGCATGVIIGDRQILTVDHIFGKDGQRVAPSNFVAIFNWIDYQGAYSNYKNFDPYNYFRIVGFDEYGGTALERIKIPGTQARMDLSIIKTDRILDKDIVALNLYQAPDIKETLKGKELFIIGHCLNLPQVIAGNAFCNPIITYPQADLKIRNLTAGPQSPLTDDQFDRLMFADFDGFKGNSGSPVFVKDEKLDWMVVGIYRGGEQGFAVENGEVVENIYSKEMFTSGEKFEHFQLLNDIRFNRNCSDDCDYINIREGGINPPVNELTRGENICVTLPWGMQDGSYRVKFHPSLFVTVVYTSGEPNRETVCRVVPNARNYNVELLNERGTVVHDFYRTGIASGNSLGKRRALEHDLNEHGAMDDVVNFVPNVSSGDIPLYAYFAPVIPDNEEVQAFYWEFGDGETSDQMYPTHTYTSPGAYDVKLTVTFSDRTEDFLYEECIVVSQLVKSIQNVREVISQETLVLSGIDTENQVNGTTCVSNENIVIYPETILRMGSNIILRIN